MPAKKQCMGSGGSHPAWELPKHLQENPTHRVPLHLVPQSDKVKVIPEKKK